MTTLARVFLLLCLFAAIGLAGEQDIPTRELFPLTSTRVEKIFYMNMDRIKVPVTDQEIEADFLLYRMSKCDQIQNGDRGGTINRATEGEDWNPKQKIQLTEKEYSYRRLLDEICRQENLYWWVEDNPWIGVIIGSKSTYQEHALRPAFQSPTPENPNVKILSSWWVPVSSPNDPEGKSEAELLANPPLEKPAADSRFPSVLGYRPRYVLTFHSEDNSTFEAKIWAQSHSSWPGNNSQIIEIVKDGKRVSSRKVGGEPMMVDAWGTVWGGKRFIYIRCKERFFRRATAVYVYQVKGDFTVEDAAVVVSKEDLEKFREEFDRSLKRFPPPRP